MIDSCSFPKDILKPISDEYSKYFEDIQITKNDKFFKRMLTKKLKRGKLNNKSKEK